MKEFINSQRKLYDKEKEWEHIIVESGGAIILAFLLCQYALHILARQPLL